MDINSRSCLILVFLFCTLTGYSQNMRVRSVTSTFGDTNNGHSTFSNLTASTAVAAPAAGQVVLFASNNTFYALTSAGALIDLGSGASGLITAVAPTQLSLSSGVAGITNAPLITNVVDWFSTDGTQVNATNRGLTWAAVLIGGDAWATMRFPTRYGDNLDLVSFRSDSSATVSNILYFGNQNDGKIFAMDWKIGGIDWGNSDPRYVWNFNGNEGGLVTEQVGMYFQQHAANGGRIQLYTPDTFGGMYAIEVTGTTMRLGNLTYLVEIAGAPIQLKGTTIADSTIVHNGADQFKILTNAYSGFNVFLNLATNTMQFLSVTNNLTLILTNQNVGQKISFTMFNPTTTNVTIVLPAVQIYGSGISNVVAAGKRLKTAWESQDTAVTNVSAAFAQQKN